MIKYNFRHRGMIEYEKLILNFLPFYNEISFLATDPILTSFFIKEVEQLEKRLDSFNSLSSPSTLLVARQLQIKL